MATLPVMGYVVGGALVHRAGRAHPARFGRKASFQLGLVVAFLSALLCAYAAITRNFWLLCFATVVAGYYNANAGLYRFAAAELAGPPRRKRPCRW
jgi:MFS family permease